MSSRKWFTIKYFDLEVDVPEEELKRLYRVWETNPIAVRADGTALTDKFVHILPSPNVHSEDGNSFLAIDCPQKTQEEILEEREIYRKGWEKVREKLKKKGWKFTEEGKPFETF